MADRRMFSKTVTESDEFLDMPLSAQALYFHIGMNTDDEGYCRKLHVMRLTLGCQDDIQWLLNNRFVYLFDDKILYDLHFEKNNKIRKDRKKDSEYVKLYHKSTICQPDDNQTTAQVRLVEVRLDKKREPKKKITNSDAFASSIIALFNSIASKTVMITNPTYIKKINSIIKDLKKLGIKTDEEQLEKFRYVFTNQKKIADDPDHFWNHYKIGTLLANSNFFDYMDADHHNVKLVNTSRNTRREL